MTLYKRGMEKAKKPDHRGAIEDYSASLEASNASAELRCMVLYNRALAYVADGDQAKGTQDLELVLAMGDAPANVQAMAKQKLSRMEQRESKA